MTFDGGPTQLDRIETQCAENSRDLKQIRITLHGNGQPERGHVIRMDRLEIRAKRSDKLLWAVTGAVIVGAVGMVAAAITGAV